MLNVGPTFTKAMNLIEEAQTAGHLLSVHEYTVQHPNEPTQEYLSKIMRGVTTHPAFELTKHSMTYRLKPGISASDAIERLLASHHTLIDCGTALAICNYLVLLWEMEAIHGKDMAKTWVDKDLMPFLEKKSVILL